MNEATGMAPARPAGPLAPDGSGGKADLTKGALHLPIRLLMSWLLTTIFFFVFGPYNYHLSNAPILYLYLAAVHLALYLGYRAGLKARLKGVRKKIKGLVAVKYCLAFVVMLSAVKLIYSRGGDAGNIMMALRDPAEAYYAGSNKNAPTLFSYIDILTAPFMSLALIWGVFYWGRLKTAYRLILTALVGLALLSSIGASVRSTMVVTGLLIASAFMASYYRGNIRLGLFAKGVTLITLLTLLAAFFVYFAFLTERRSSDPKKMVNPITQEYPVEDNPIYRIVPEPCRTAYAGVVFYISHAYARLAQAIDLPFVGSGLGAGNSVFLVRNIIRLTGWDWFEDYSYGLRLDRETSSGGFGLLWSTIYTWIASDVTFPGSIVVVFLIGFLFARSWVEVLHGSSPLSVAAFSCFFIIIFSFPMNNPLQDGPGISTYFGIPLLWWLNRK